MARVNNNILGINELKWTEMGGFYSDGHYISAGGQESLRRKEVAIIINKRARDAVQTIQYYNNPSLCLNH